MLIRITLAMMSAWTLSWLSGCCCGPASCGSGFGPDHCYNCDDAGYSPPIACGPIQHMNQLRRSFVCGGGCGEVYYDEWISTPPDACDPCCGSEFVGGAVPCQPFCWQPGSLLAGFIRGIYGDRFCDGGGVPIGGCCCETNCDTGCDSGMGFGCDSECGCEGTAIPAATGGGCSTCNSTNNLAGRRFVQTTNSTGHQPGQMAASTGHRFAQTAPASTHRLVQTGSTVANRTAGRETAARRGISSTYSKPPTHFR